MKHGIDLYIFLPLRSRPCVQTWRDSHNIFTTTWKFYSLPECVSDWFSFGKCLCKFPCWDWASAGLFPSVSTLCWSLGHFLAALVGHLTGRDAAGPVQCRPVSDLQPGYRFRVFSKKPLQIKTLDFPLSGFLATLPVNFFLLSLVPGWFPEGLMISSYLCALWLTQVFPQRTMELAS